MADSPILVKCFAVTEKLRAQGMRCFARVVIWDSLSVDGLAVRVTEGGRAIVTWPERRDGEGRLHLIVRILDEPTRRAVERTVLAEAVRGGWLEQGRVQREGSAS